MPTSSTQQLVLTMVSSTGQLITEMLPFGYLLFGLFIAIMATGAFLFFPRKLAKFLSRRF